MPITGPTGWIGIASSADGTRLVAIDLAGGQDLWMSDDSGQTWKARNTGRSWTKIISSADGARLAGISSYNLIGDFQPRLEVSMDYGETWKEKGGLREWSDVAGSADGLKLAATSGVNGVSADRIYTSTAQIPTVVYRPAPNVAGTPYASFTFQVQDDGKGTTTLDPVANTFTFNVTGLPDALLVALPLPDRTVLERGAISYQFPAGTFVDPDGIGPLTYSAALENGGPLPPWLQFNPGTRTFSGTPGAADTGSLAVRVTATESSLPVRTIHDTFQLTVTNLDDAPAGKDQSVVLAPGTPLTFGAAHFGFSDPGDVPPDTFTRVKLTTLPAAGSLTIEGTPVAAGSYVSFITRTIGQLWTARETVRSWYAIASSADGLKLAALVFNGQIHTSTDAGATWTPRETVRNWYHLSSSADGMKLAAVVQNGLIYVSTDAGATWTGKASARVWRAIASSADGSRLAAVEQNGAIHISADGGETWTERESARNWFSIASSADGTRLAACVYGGQIWTSTDSGETWTARESVRNWRTVTLSEDGTRLAACVYSGQLYVS